MTTNRNCNRRFLPAALIAVFLGTLASEASAQGGLFRHKRHRTVAAPMPMPATCRGGSCQPRVPVVVAPTAPAAYLAPAPQVWAQYPPQGACQGGNCARR